MWFHIFLQILSLSGRTANKNSDWSVWENLQRLTGGGCFLLLNLLFYWRPYLEKINISHLNLDLSVRQFSVGRIPVSDAPTACMENCFNKEQIWYGIPCSLQVDSSWKLLREINVIELCTGHLTTACLENKRFSALSSCVYVYI